MLTADIEKFLSHGLDIMGISLENEPAVLSRLSLYFQELKKWNKKINLVARSLDDRQILENHFLDSLSLISLLPLESKEQETILDVGSGAADGEREVAAGDLSRAVGVFDRVAGQASSSYT